MEETTQALPQAYRDIEGFDTFTKITPIREGLSSDRKYAVETVCGRLRLRISDIAEYERKRTIFRWMEKAAALGVPMSRPVAFGVCDGGKLAYQLWSWCDGETLEPILPQLPEAEQYALGLQAGQILRQIHRIPAPVFLEDWGARYCGENDGRVKAFSACGVTIPGSEIMLRYYEDNKPLLTGRPQCFHHGDYHVGNLMVSQAGALSVIDWEPLDYNNLGDPWEEFNAIGSSEMLPAYFTGEIRGYFDGEPPAVFWRLLAFYLAAGALMGVSWAFYRQPDLLEDRVQNAANILRCFDGMRNPVPTWYQGDIT